MLNIKHNAMKQEAIADIIETLKYYDGYYCDLHNEVFNTDYYIIGTYKAKQILNEYGAFEAIDLVQTYERNNFGEVYTDISDYEKLLNMVYYIIGEEVCSDIDTLNDNWDNVANSDTNEVIIKELQTMQQIIL